MTTKKTYQELMMRPTFADRLAYLMQGSRVGRETFGSARYLNQDLYQRSEEWREARRRAIVRDNGCDLGCPDRKIEGPIHVHHMNGLAAKDILEHNEHALFGLDGLICCSDKTHKALTYGRGVDKIARREAVERRPNDTCPWK